MKEATGVTDGRSEERKRRQRKVLLQSVILPVDDEIQVRIRQLSLAPGARGRGREGQPENRKQANNQAGEESNQA